MRLSVVIPVYNGAAYLRECLAAVAASERKPDEVIVVDDGSTDGSLTIAEEAGATVLAADAGRRRGPAVARNVGVERASGDVIAFIDADVRVHPGTLDALEDRVRNGFRGRPVDAVFGSYDDNPPARTAVSLYKNLLHHWTHQRGNPEASTFWTACGAVRRDAFLAVGGFDAAYKCIEDVEMGMRMRARGMRIALDPTIQVAHLKRWTVRSWLRTDIHCRAIPWSRLIARDGLVNDLNFGWASRVSAGAAWGLAASLAAGLVDPRLWLLSLLCVALLLACNFPLMRFFRRRGGAAFAAAAGVFHTVYFLYSSAVFAAIAGPPKLARHALWVIVATTLVKGFAWAIAMPAWIPNDEVQHYLYAYGMVHHRTASPPPSKDIPADVIALADVVGFGSVEFRQDRKVAVVDPAADPAQIAEARRVLADPMSAGEFVRDQGRRFVRHTTFNLYHPPLYYAAQAPVVAMATDAAPLPARLLAGRLLSVLCLAGTVVFAYLVGRELFRRGGVYPPALAVLVSFQPLATFHTSVLNNEAAVLLLLSAATYALVRTVRRGITPGRAAALAGMAAAGLLTKSSFLIAGPLYGVVALITLLTRRRRARSALLWAAVALVPTAATGWWYVRALDARPAIIEAYAESPLPSQPGTLVGYLVTNDWVEDTARVLSHYWAGNIGNSARDAALPIGVRIMFIAVTAACTAAVLARLFRLAKRRGRPLDMLRAPPRFVLLLTLLALPTLLTAAFYHALDFMAYRDMQDGYFRIRGQYYAPAIIGQMVWLLVGWRLILGRACPRVPTRVAASALAALLVTANLWLVLFAIRERYYGVPLTEWPAAVAELQPLPPWLVGLGLLAFAGFSVASLAVVWGSATDAQRVARVHTPASAERAAGTQAQSRTPAPHSLAGTPMSILAAQPAHESQQRP